MRRAFVIASIFLIPSCANPQPISAAEVGRSCPSAQSSESSANLSNYVSPSRRRGEVVWLHVTRKEQWARGTFEKRSDRPSLQRMRFRSPARLNGKQTPGEVMLTKRTLDEAVSELDRGAGIVLASSTAPLTRVVASIRPDGTVVFIGECASQRFTPSFSRFVDQRKAAGDTRSAGDILLAFATDQSLANAFADVDNPEPTPVVWDDIPADRRSIDPDGAPKPPAEVMADLKPHLLHVRIPESWKSFDATIAAFVPDIGWNSAMPFGIDSASPSIPVYASVTKPLEIWALPSDGSLTAPLAKLASLDAASLASLDDVYMATRVEAASLDDLLAQARSGKAVFELTSPRGD